MFACQGWLGVCEAGTLASSKSMSGFLELGDCMGKPWKRIEERRQHMGKVARMCGDLTWRAPFEYGDRPRVWGRKTHENQGHGGGVSLRTLRVFDNTMRETLGYWE